MNDVPLPIVLHRYPSYSYEGALDAYAADMLPMAESGYFPVAMTWGWNPEGDATVLLGGSSWKPGVGTLAVTFRREDGGAR